MKKSDLKTGMRIDVRGDYETAIVFVTDNGVFAPTACGSYHAIDLWNKDLTQPNFETLDIIRVYDLPPNPRLVDFDAKGKLLWERKEETPICEIDGVEYSEEALRSIIKKATS